MKTEIIEDSQVNLIKVNHKPSKRFNFFLLTHFPCQIEFTFCIVYYHIRSVGKYDLKG